MERFDYRSDSELQRLAAELTSTKGQKQTLLKEGELLKGKLTTATAAHQQRKIDLRITRASTSDVEAALKAMDDATVAVETNIGQLQIIEEQINALEKQLDAARKRAISEAKELQSKVAYTLITAERDAFQKCVEAVETAHRFYLEIQNLPPEGRLRIEGYLISPSALRDVLNADVGRNFDRVFNSALEVLEKQSEQLKRVS